MTGSNYTLTRDIEFAVHDGVSLQGHMWKPQGDGPFPAVIAIHGGGWRQGGPDRYRHWGPYMAERGFVLFSVTYRLTAPSNKPVWPQAPCDVRAAVQFLRSQASRFDIDADRIALMGDSAGGHLASLIALAGDSAMFAGQYMGDSHADVSARVKAAVSIYGVHDLVQQWHHDQAVRPHDHIVELFLGCAPMDDRKLYFDASPLSHAIRANAGPDFLLAHGTEDDIADRVQTDEFHTALKLAGFYTRKLIIQGAGHFAVQEPFDIEGSFSGYLGPRVVEFLQERMT